jgi:uracil-DNA glycosylase
MTTPEAVADRGDPKDDKDDKVSVSAYPGKSRSAIPEDWREALRPVLTDPRLRDLSQQLKRWEDAGKIIYPPMPDRFRALQMTPLGDVRVVILGQDPYHGPGQAHGLSFSVPPGVAQPPSLRNILQEMAADIGVAPSRHGCLESWALQGVLLLNTALTVEAGMAGSHSQLGWSLLTEAIIKTVNDRPGRVVFVLWGSHAQRYAPLLDPSRHLIVRSPHPSPLSAYRGFFGSKPFSKINRFLTESGDTPIDWQLPA